MAQASLEKLVKKLDEVEAKLNRIEAKLAGGSGAGAGAAPAAGGASVDAWDALVSAHITKFIEDSKKIADDVGQIAELFLKALNEERAVIAKASTMKKPADISSLIGGLAAAIGAVTEYEGKQRKTQHRDHLSAVANGINALVWVTVEKTPGPAAKEQGETAFMYTNRILTAYKGKDPIHTEWAKSFADFLKELPVYIKNFHTTGLTFAH